MANRKKTTLIVIHTTATPADMGLTVSKLRSMHKARGFSDIGYNVWISRDGKRQKGRGWDARGAHVAGYNSIAFGVSWEGGWKGNDMTKAQEKELLSICREAVKRYPGAKICGHRDLSPDGDRDGVVEPHEWTKTCPWFDAEAWAAKHGLPHTNFSGKAGVGPIEEAPEPPDARIMWLQKLLKQEGYTIAVDGYEGPRTKETVETFQVDHGLRVTGNFDTETVFLLRERANEREEANKAKPEIPAEIIEVAKDAAAEGRPSKTDLATIALTAGGGLSAVNQVAQQVGDTKDTLSGFLPGWAVLLILLAILGVGFFKFWERRRKKLQGRNALAKIRNMIDV